NAANYGAATQTKTTGRRSTFTVMVEKRGTEFNVYVEGTKVIRDRLTCVDVAGFTEIKNLLTNVVKISNVKIYEAKYMQYMPILTDTEAWGAYDAVATSTKPKIGGNGVNHPSTILLEYVYNECLRELADDLKVASI